MTHSQGHSCFVCFVYELINIWCFLSSCLCKLFFFSFPSFLCCHFLSFANFPFICSLFISRSHDVAISVWIIRISVFSHWQKSVWLTSTLVFLLLSFPLLSSLSLYFPETRTPAAPNDVPPPPAHHLSFPSPSPLPCRGWQGVTGVWQ